MTTHTGLTPNATHAHALWCAGEWDRLVPILSAWAARGVPRTLWLSADDVDDIVAHVLGKAWAMALPPENPPAWCHLVARRRALDAIRRAPTVDISDVEIAVERTVARFDADDVQRLHTSLMRLAPPFRECVVRRFLREQSLAEIAAELGVTLATVKNRIHRGTRQLAAIFNASSTGWSAV